MPSLTTDNAARLLIVLLGLWAVLEHYRSRRIPGTYEGQTRRRLGTSIFLVSLSLAYAGGMFETGLWLLDCTRWASRAGLMVGVMLVALGYRMDRRPPDA